LDEPKENNDWEHSKNIEIWRDELNMMILNGKQLLDECNAKEKARVSKHILHYYWNNDNLVLKGLVVR
jgi:hypothetical protein